MFELIFSRQSTITEYYSAPLLKERLSYLAHCMQIGIKSETLCKIASRQLKLVHILNLQYDDLNLDKTEARFRQWYSLEECKLRPLTQRRFFNHTKRWMRFLGWLEEPEAASHAHMHEVKVFATRMSSENGWSDATLEGYYYTVNCFFFWLDERGTDLASVKITEIDQFIARYHARGYNRSTIHLYAQQLRRFFRFTEQQGWSRLGLADGIMPPRRYPSETIQKGLKRDEVIRLLKTTEGDTPYDIRARAILMLLITYGLRAGEVSILKLDDLDWEKDILQVRCPKPGRTHLYPLSRGVGQSILRYLREVRPTHPERRLFLTMRAPIKPLSRGVIKSVVSGRVKRLGITGKRRGPHALRHAAAQHLLDQGLSMKAVGDYLGHRSVMATSVYAKVQLKTLREVAEINLEGLL